jgi:DedD protein
MTPRNDSEAEDRYLEFQLDGKQVIIVLAGILLLCAVSFHFGRRIGRAEAAGPAGDVPALMPQATGGEALSDEDAASDLTFFDTVGRSDGGAKPPAVTTGAGADTPGSARGGAAGEEPASSGENSGSRAAPPAAAAAPEPEPAPRAATPPAPRGGGGFDLQVAAYSDQARAEALASRLGQKGYSARVVTMRADGRTLYKVWVGSYGSRAEAEAQQGRLEREEKLNSFVVEAGG